MFKTRVIDPPYPARVTKALLVKWNGEVRVWDSPRSAIEGAEVLDIITSPCAIRVVEEQLDMYGSIPQRARVSYRRGKEGWIIYDMLHKTTPRQPKQ